MIKKTYLAPAMEVLLLEVEAQMQESSPNKLGTGTSGSTSTHGLSKGVSVSSTGSQGGNDEGWQS